MRGQRATAQQAGPEGSWMQEHGLLCPSTGLPLCADMPRVWNAAEPEGRAAGWNKDISLAITSLAGLLYRFTLSTGAYMGE
jgi:hypothetical protein